MEYIRVKTSELINQTVQKVKRGPTKEQTAAKAEAAAAESKAVDPDPKNNVVGEAPKKPKRRQRTLGEASLLGAMNELKKLERVIMLEGLPVY